MASPFNAALCALLAAAFWTVLGTALGRRLLPRALARGAAPVIGWAAHSAVMLPIYPWIGFSPIAVLGTGALCVLASGFSLSGRAPRAKPKTPRTFQRGCSRRSRSRARAGRRHPAQIFRRRRAACRSDLRSFQDRDRRCDGAARPAAGQSGVRRIRRAGPSRLLLSLAFQRRRAGAGARRKRLGSRHRIDVVHRLRVAERDDGRCRLARQANRRGDLGRRSRRRRVAVGDARLDRRRPRSDALAVAAGWNGRLAVSGDLGPATSDGGVMRGDGDAAASAASPSGRARRCWRCWSSSSSPVSKARALSAV